MSFKEILGKQFLLIACLRQLSLSMSGSRTLLPGEQGRPGSPLRGIFFDLPIQLSAFILSRFQLSPFILFSFRLFLSCQSCLKLF